MTDYLLAEVIDHLAGANWQRSGDRTASKPRPRPRPGVRPETDGTVRQFGTAVATKEELLRRLYPRKTDDQVAEMLRGG